MNWNCDLEIGSQLRIKISAYIDAKDTPMESWSVDTADSAVTTKTSYYLNDKELSAGRQPDIIKAFVYGKTPVAYDESLGMSGGEEDEKCFVCIGFTDENNITDECLAGTGIWSVVPQVGLHFSEKLFVSLVAAMKQKKQVLIVRYVYRKKTQPRVMALFTRQSTVPFKNSVSLSMMELLYAG